MGRWPAVSIDVHLDTLVEVCSYYYEQETAFSHIEGVGGINQASNAIYISDLAQDDRYFSILLVRGDPGRSLPSLVNPANRTVKPVVADEPGDVPGASCHLIISKARISKGQDGGRHRVAMERTRGVGRALARDFLTQLMHRYADEFPDKYTAERVRKSKSDKVEVLSYRPTVAFHAQQNGSLKADLQAGKIGGFKLVRGSTEFQGEANDAKVQKLDVQLTARIVPTEDFGRVKSLIDHIRQSLDSIAFEALNFELVDDKGDPLVNTKQISVDNLDDGDMRYVKTIPIEGLGETSSECYAAFHHPILVAGKAAIAKDKNWN